MFFASIESMAFMESDRERHISASLSFIPENCRTAKAMLDLLRWHCDGAVWTEARELVIKHHGYDNFTDAPQNRYSVVASHSNPHEVDAAFAGHRQQFAEAMQTDEPGIYWVSTRLVNPRDRSMKLIIATTSPVTAVLNGDIIIDDRLPAAWMPAFHRVPASRSVIIHLPAGDHQLELEVVKDNESLDVYVLPRRDNNTRRLLLFDRYPVRSLMMLLLDLYLRIRVSSKRQVAISQRSRKS